MCYGQMMLSVDKCSNEEPGQLPGPRFNENNDDDDNNADIFAFVDTSF